MRPFKCCWADDTVLELFDNGVDVVDDAAATAAAAAASCCCDKVELDADVLRSVLGTLFVFEIGKRLFELY